MENLLELFYKKVMNSEKPAFVINEFYSKLFNLEITTENSILFAKLINVFGRERVFFAVMDLTTISNLRHENIYPLLYAICKNNFVEQYDYDSPDLSSLIEEIKKSKESNKILNVGDPFEW